MAFEISESEIRKALALLKPDNELFEIRMINGKGWTTAGYFRDVDAMMTALEDVVIDPKANIYVTLNEIDDACYDREAHDVFVRNMSPTTGDNDITRYKWLMVDVDPIRKSGTSSTDDQVTKSRALARKIFGYLKNQGWSDPIVALSGNGTHLLYRINLLNNKDNQELVQNVLATLNMLFNDGEMDIDKKTFNPARICKLYGTYARKGANTPTRPWRLSKILYAPDQPAIIQKSYLEKLVQLLPKPEKPQQYNSYNPASFDLQAWIDEHGIQVSEKIPWNGGTKWILDHCAFNPQHNHKDASIIQTSDGKICYNCFHNSCSGYHWKEFRQLYEPDAYDGKKVQPAVPNYLATKPENFGKNQEAVADPREVDDLGPVFRTTEEIRQRPAPDEAFIKTGINGIDTRMVGLKKGFVSVLSGLRSAGKSSILSQIVIQCREQGLKTALFSGEMNDKQVLKWLTLQAAGKAHVHGTQYPNVFYPDDAPAVRISEWLNDFVFIYNNDYGNKFTDILKQLTKIITEKQLDVVLIDNLMALNIEELDRDMYVRQKNFVLMLKQMAKTLNVHVLFVAHPRKADGYLRMDDISGSGDLVNAADNVFIIHRVDDDYKNLTKQFFHWKDTNPLYQADNVIEICKDRDFGNRDVHVPLYFERESKRLKNEQAEVTHYSWERDAQTGLEYVDDPLPWEE